MRDLPGPPARGRPARGQRDPGDPGAAAAAPRDRWGGRGAAARAVGRRPANVGGARAPGAQAARRRAAARATSVPLGARSGSGRRPATRSGSNSSATTTLSRCSTATARCRCRRTSPSALGDPERYQTVFADEPGSAAAPTAGLHFTPELFDRLAGARRRASATVELVVGLDTFQPISTDDPLDHPMHTERYRVPRRRRWRACRDAGRVVAVGTTAVRALESAAALGRARRAHRPLHPPWVRLAGGRRADDELPPPADDAADDDRRVRRPALADALRRRARRRLPLPVLRRRHAARPPTRSDGVDAHTVAGDARRSDVRRSTPPTAPHAPGTATTARGSYRTPLLHAGRHTRGDQVPERRRLRAPRRPDRARQHLPPDAASRGRTWSSGSAGSGRFAGWDGLTLTDSGGFQVFSLDPKVDDDGVTFKSTYDGSTHRFTPEIAVARPGAARRRHPDGARRLPAAAEPAAR